MADAAPGGSVADVEDGPVKPTIEQAVADARSTLDAYPDVPLVGPSGVVDR
jgi:hypothetical protein